MIRKMRKILHKYLTRRGWKKLSLTELQLLQLSPWIIQEWVNSRKFRRQIQGTELAKRLAQIVNEWKTTPNNRTPD